MIKARVAARSPKAAFATMPPGSLLATSDDPFMMRLRAGVLIRSGKAGEAIEPLLEAWRSAKERLPVEELLLALAYLQTNRFAKRYDAFGWETWYECDVFRSEVEGRMRTAAAN